MKRKYFIPSLIVLSVLFTLSLGFAGTNGSYNCIGGNQKVGDVNGDGIINSDDVSILFNFVDKNVSNICCGDVNNNGRLDYDDIVELNELVQGSRICFERGYSCVQSENCTDGVDNDCDGKVDSEDSDCQPDLIISDIYIIPENPIEGEKIRFNVVVKNVGYTTPKNDVWVNYYLNGEPMQTSAAANPSYFFEPGESYTFWTEYSQGFPAGKYSFTAKIDENNYIPESNEDNNEKTVNFTIASQACSLSATALDTKEECEAAGCDWLTDTHGCAPSGVWPITECGYKPYNYSCSIKAYPYSWKFEGAVSECYNCDCNWCCCPGFGNKKQVEKPDFIIAKITWQPKNPKEGDDITFYSTIKNIGDTISRDNGKFEVCSYIDNKQFYCKTVGVEWGTKIEKNEAYTYVWPTAGHTVPVSLTPGSHTFTVKVTRLINLVEESNEDNNEKTVNFTIVSQTINCTDSDGGKNYYVKGKVTQTEAGQQTTLVDFCIDEETLNEGFCEDGEIQAIKYECPGGCKDGKCVGVSLACDSYGDMDNDGYITKKDVDILFDLIGKTVTEEQKRKGDVNGNGGLDFDDPVKLNSYLEGKIDTLPVCEQVSQCGNGICEDGENLENCPEDCNISCIDTDEGINYYTPGVVTAYNKNNEKEISPDYCNNGILYESYCNNNTAAKQLTNCSNGCVGAQCLKENEIGQDYKIYKNQEQTIELDGEEYKISASSCTAVSPPTINITYRGETKTFRGDFYEEKRLSLGNKEVYVVVTSCPATTNFFWMSLIEEKPEAKCGNGKCDSINLVIKQGEKLAINFRGKDYSITFIGIDKERKGAVVNVNNFIDELIEGHSRKIAGIDILLKHLSIFDASSTSNERSVAYLIIGENCYTCPQDCGSCEEEEGYSLKLYKGWNMVSSPIKSALPISKIEEYCDLVEYKGYKVWRWNPKSNTWEHPNALTPGYGYYLKVKEDCVVKIDGKKFKFENLSINKGWNMISPGDITLDQILGSCKDLITSYKGYKVWRWNPKSNTWEHPEKFELGKAYFIYSKADCKLSEFEIPVPTSEIISKNIWNWIKSVINPNKV